MKKMVLIPYDQFTKGLRSENLKSDDHILRGSQLDQALSTCDQISDPSGSGIEHLPQKLDKDLILYPFGERYINHAKTLLHYIENILSWNEKGEIIINGEAIHGSHITDLLKDALSTYKNFKPIGYESFYKNLASVPQFLIRNPERRILIGGGKSESIKNPSIPNPPPPSIPIDKKPVRIVTTIDQWKSRWQRI